MAGVAKDDVVSKDPDDDVQSRSKKKQPILPIASGSNVTRRSGKTSKSTAPPSPSPAEILDESQQEEVIVDMLHANLQARRMLRGGLCTLYGVLVIASIYLGWNQFETPFAGDAGYFAPLRPKGVIHADVMLAMLLVGLSCAVSCYTTARGEVAAPVAPFLPGQEARTDGAATNRFGLFLSLIPLVHWGGLFVRYWMWDLWPYAWIPLLPPVLHGAQLYCDKLFRRMDSDVFALISRMYAAKSA